MPKTKKNKDDREEIITKEIKKSFKDDPIYDKEVASEDIETYQNDRTISPDSRMFKQLPEEQLLKYQGGGIAHPEQPIKGVKPIQVKGRKFQGIF
jgi:hypothetical protein